MYTEWASIVITLHMETCININKLIWAKKYMHIEKVTYLPVKFLQATATPTSPFVFIHFSRLILKVNNSEFIL